MSAAILRLDCPARSAETTDTRHEGRRYGRVSSAVMRSPALSIQARMVYAVLATYADRQGVAYPSIGRLVEEIGLSKPHIIRYIDELEEAGILVKEGNQRARKYRLIGNASVTSNGNANVTDEGNGNADVTRNGNASVTPVLPEEYREEGEGVSGARASDPEPVAPMPTGWPTDLLPAYIALTEALGKPPGSKWGSTITQLLLPRGHPQAARDDHGTSYSGFTLDDVLEGIRRMSVREHHSINSLILHTAGRMESRTTKSSDGTGRKSHTGASGEGRPASSYERRLSLTRDQIDSSRDQFLRDIGINPAGDGTAAG